MTFVGFPLTSFGPSNYIWQTLMSKGIIYARVSTDEQASTSLASIPHQIDLCKKLATTDKVEIVSVVTDDITGQTVERPGLNKIFSALGSGVRLYAYDTTRLGRNRKVLTTIRDRITQAGAILRLVHGDTSEMDEESGIYLQSVLDASAEAEIVRFKRRTRMGRERRAERGLMAGKIPIGWLAVRDDQGKTIDYAHDPAWDNFFRDLEKILLSGAPFSSFPRALQSKGYLSPNTGRMWSVTALKGILRNPVNMGDVIFGWTSRPFDKRIINRGVFPPRWQNPSSVSTELKRRDLLRGSARKQRYRLTGILVCAHCGWKMTSNPRKYQTKHGENTWVRYRCTKHSEYQGGRWYEDCQANYINEKQAIAQIAQWLRSMADPQELERYIWTNYPSNTETLALGSIKKRISEIDGIMTGLVDRLAIVPPAAMHDVRSRMDDLARERSILEEQLEIEKVQSQRVIDIEQYKEKLLIAAEHVDDLLSQAPAHQVQSILHSLFPDGLPVGDGQIIL